MKLLDPEKVTAEKKKGEQEIAERIRKLNDEESASVKRLNEAHAKEESEKGRIAKDLIDHQRSTDLRKKELAQEVLALEERRKDALKPIHETQLEVEKRLKEVAEKENQLESDRIALAEARAELSERLEDVSDREAENSEKSRELDDREWMIKAEESKLAESAQSLAEKWSKYHKEIHEANASILQREKDVENGRKSNESVRQSNAEESNLLVQERRALHDGYIALEQAKKHLGLL
jgi:uncharacterized phage infection (PIP) family protein YhgE